MLLLTCGWALAGKGLPRKAHRVAQPFLWSCTRSRAFGTRSTTQAFQASCRATSSDLYCCGKPESDDEIPGVCSRDAHISSNILNSLCKTKKGTESQVVNCSEMHVFEHGRDSFVRLAHGKMKCHRFGIHHLHVVSLVPASADG